ncbi:hypothetical protein OROMI_012019 [Orobanche minor]
MCSFRMSDNRNTPEFDPVENEDETKKNIVKFENPSQPRSENQESCPENTSESESTIEEEEEKENEDIPKGIKNEGGEGKSVHISENKSENQIASDDEDEFKTPTSSEHRIPAITECPPAPRRPPPPKWKRKSCPTSRRRLALDSSEEVESLFRQVADIDDQEPRNKKARRDDDLDEGRL